jgi:hypothetical protein
LNPGIAGTFESLLGELSGQLGRVMTALLPALPQVVGEAINLPDIRAGGPLRELPGVKEPANSAAVQAHLSGDLPHGQAFSMQFDHLGVDLQSA